MGEVKCYVCGGPEAPGEYLGGFGDGYWHKDPARCINILQAEINRLQAIERAAQDVVASHFGIAPELSWQYVMEKLVEAMDPED